MKKLKSFHTLFEAEVACSLLKNEGIEAVVLNEFSGQGFPYAGNHIDADPCIAVADEDLEQAAAILNITAAESAPTVCPHCGSGKVAFGFGNIPLGKRIIGYLMMPISLIANVPIGKVRMGYYCKSCRYDIK